MDDFLADEVEPTAGPELMFFVNWTWGVVGNLLVMVLGYFLNEYFEKLKKARRIPAQVTV